MPRRSILSATERDNLIALPEGEDDLIRYYTSPSPIYGSVALLIERRNSL